MSDENLFGRAACVWHAANRIERPAQFLVDVISDENSFEWATYIPHAAPKKLLMNAMSDENRIANSAQTAYKSASNRFLTLQRFSRGVFINQLSAE